MDLSIYLTVASNPKIKHNNNKNTLKGLIIITIVHPD